MLMCVYIECVNNNVINGMVMCLLFSWTDCEKVIIPSLFQKLIRLFIRLFIKIIHQFRATSFTFYKL